MFAIAPTKPWGKFAKDHVMDCFADFYMQSNVVLLHSAEFTALLNYLLVDWYALQLRK